MKTDKTYVMDYIEAKTGEEFTVPEAAREVNVEYRETDAGQKYVRVSWLNPIGWNSVQ